MSRGIERRDMSTKIEWCDATINALKMRCTPISEGCKNCYALKLLERNLPGMASYPNKGEMPVFVESEAAKPMKWKKSKRIFWQSMGDLFHDDVTLLQQRQIFSYMKYAPQHTHIILTKRPGMMHAVMNEYFFKNGANIPNNWWLGVTAENQQRADERIPILLQIPSAVHFVSVEPILGPVDLKHYLPDPLDGSVHIQGIGDLPPLDWVICGGETGVRARPASYTCVMNLKDQCAAMGTPFFFKKWGTATEKKFSILPEKMPREWPEI